MAQQKPTVLFVHGAWHCPEHLAPIARVFEAAGYPTCCPRLPSYGAPEPKAATLSNDAAAVRAQLDRLIEKEGKDVVVVLHSYGGMVGSEAVHASLGKSQRAAEGKPGGVLRLVYLTAFLLPEGVSMVSAANGVWPPFVTRNDDESLCFNLEPSQRLYHDVPPAEQQRCIALLKPHPVSTMRSPLTYCAYKHHPVSYIFCEDDQAVVLEFQKAMADGAGVEVTTATLPSSHSPFLSMPEKLLEAVQTLAGI